MKRIIITENQYKKILCEHENTVNFIIDYLKRFMAKGKLESSTKSLKEYYMPYLQQAFEWASEKCEDVRRDGFAYFKHSFNINVMNNIKQNKRGLIYVERCIDISSSQDLENTNYTSVGECWSWKKGNSSNYCSDFSVLGNARQVVLCGYVHPDSIDWLETLYLNSYDMKNETEVRMNENATVEIAYVKINGQKYSLGGSYITKAHSDKYRKKEW